MIYSVFGFINTFIFRIDGNIAFNSIIKRSATWFIVYVIFQCGISEEADGDM